MTILSKQNKIFIALLLASLIINIGTLVSVVNRPLKPVIVYKADNSAVMHGKITGNTLDCGLKERGK